MKLNDRDPIEILRDLIDRHGGEPPARGRPVSAFRTDPQTDAHYPATRAAYTLRFVHCKILTALDQGKPCIDPVREVASASARRTLWLYMHHCLPTCLIKMIYLELLDQNDSTSLMKEVEGLILQMLAKGTITDAGFAVSVLDDENFFNFARDWLTRPKRGR